MNTLNINHYFKDLLLTIRLCAHSLSYANIFSICRKNYQSQCYEILPTMQTNKWRRHVRGMGGISVAWAPFETGESYISKFEIYTLTPLSMLKTHGQT